MYFVGFFHGFYELVLFLTIDPANRPSRFQSRRLHWARHVFLQFLTGSRRLDLCVCLPQWIYSMAGWLQDRTPYHRGWNENAFEKKIELTVGGEQQKLNCFYLIFFKKKF